MRCPYCGNLDTRVTDSRPIKEGAGIRRRRECASCGTRFTTYEYIELEALAVVKKDGRREDFSRQKLAAGLRKAFEKRPVSSDEIDQIADEILTEIQKVSDREISSSLIGNMILERLLDRDHVAYIRFASVYQDFQDVEQFRKALKGLRKVER